MSIIRIFNPKTKKYSIIDTKKCIIIGTSKGGELKDGF